MDAHRNPDGTYNGVKVLAGVARMPEAEVQKMWDEVKANQAKLDACDRHEFGPVGDWPNWRRRRQCARCGGFADPIVVHWYERGLRHGGARG